MGDRLFTLRTKTVAQQGKHSISRLKNYSTAIVARTLRQS
jgi:hypothetical protein